MTALIFQEMTPDQWLGAVESGSESGATSPFVTMYNVAMAVARSQNIDPRVLLAWTRAENGQATNISATLLAIHNYAGIKYVGQSRAYQSTVLPPANERGVYAGFVTDADFWYTLAVNITTLIPEAWAAGDLGSIASYYTTGDMHAGGGANKVVFYHDYLNRYPPEGGSVAVGVYGEDIVAALIPHLGEMNSDGSLDPWNGPHPWPGYCEASTEGAQYAAGLANVVHRGSAALKLDAVISQGLLQTSWPPEDGSICLWGRSFDPNGHATVWSAAKAMWISTLYPPNRGLDYYYSDAWKAAMAGWYRAPGVVAASRPTPLPIPQPSQTPFFVDGNPYGPVPVRQPFWPRWDALNTMGVALSHPGAVNPDGLALAMIGYPVAAEVTLPSGRRVQRFERGYLAINRGTNPFDVVMLMLNEQPQ